MANNFEALWTNLGPDRQRRVRARAHQATVAMLRADVQEHVAADGDIQISTLRRLIEALGGELELIAHLPMGDVRITQFMDRAG